MEKFDIVVIGSGPGGYPAAIRSAQLGASAAIIEKEQLGGTCLNWGCIPTKTLIASSDLFWKMKTSKELGLVPGDNGYDYSAMINRKKGVVDRLQNGIGQLLKANGVTLIQGTGSFVQRNRISVTGPDGNKTEIEAGKTIIATGSDSAIPGFIPKSDRIVDSKAFLDLTVLPKELLVLGGGVIGCEFACMAAQLGTKVTIVEMLEDILVMLDPDVRRMLRQHMERKLGIKIITGAPMKDIEVKGDSVTGCAGDQNLSAEMLLVAIGRKPVTEGLGLENAGLSTNDRGYIEIDEFCRTKVSSIYAVGDVTAGTTQLAHAATSQGVTAAENAIGQRPAKTNPLVPACIFTSPEIGIVGVTEKKAKEDNLEVKTGKFMFAGLGKAMASGETTGFVKLVADAETDRLIGAQAVGPHATELISEAAAAIKAELTAEELGRTIHCHPTFSEAWMEAAHALHGTCIHAAPVKKRNN